MNWRISRACAALSAMVVLFAGASVVHAQGASKGPIVLERMGSLYAGGTVLTAPGTWNPADPNPFGASAGQTLHADHVYAQYKIQPDRSGHSPWSCGMDA